MRFFLKDSDNPNNLLSQFHEYASGYNYKLPPFWSFGYHQSRWGYQNITAIENVITKFEENDIPLDTLWSDIDYMVNS